MSFKQAFSLDAQRFSMIQTNEVASERHQSKEKCLHQLQMATLKGLLSFLELENVSYAAPLKANDATKNVFEA